MNAFLNLLSRFVFWITFGPHRDRREQIKRRSNYDFLKAQISERHFAGYGGLTVDFHGRKFDRIDMECFRPPMYGVVRNQKGHWCIFWDRAKLTNEIGVGAPLKDGEVIVPQTNDRVWKQIDTEAIDDQKPLTHQESGCLGDPPTEEGA